MIVSTMTDAEFLGEVKRYVLELDPQAEVWLFGSRARGDARPDSDWDFLVLTEKPVTWSYKSELRGHLFDIGLTSGQTISTIIQSKNDMPLLAISDLYLNVTEEGKQL